MNDWNRFGKGDRRGALNYITSEMITQAANAVQTGEVISLNAPLDSFQSPVGRPGTRRTVRQHNQLRPLGGGRFAVVNDDNLEFSLQGSSQWDSFAHFGVIDRGSDDVFHGGLGLEETFPHDYAKTLGIDSFGGAICGRGVFIDVVAHVAGSEADRLDEPIPIGRELLEQCLERQGTELRRGDIAVVYTGFFGAVRHNGGAVPQVISGLIGDSIALWERSEIAALACDNIGVEYVDFGRDGLPTDFAIHVELLRNRGIPLGELWQLDGLARSCRRDGRYDFFLTSAPLNLPGAFGSPANVLAIR